MKRPRVAALFMFPASVFAQKNIEPSNVRRFLPAEDLKPGRSAFKRKHYSIFPFNPLDMPWDKI
jgi:hypothetical protein